VIGGYCGRKLVRLVGALLKSYREDDCRYTRTETCSVPNPSMQSRPLEDCGRILLRKCGGVGTAAYLLRCRIAGGTLIPGLPSTLPLLGVSVAGARFEAGPRCGGAGGSRAAPTKDARQDPWCESPGTVGDSLSGRRCFLASHLLGHVQQQSLVVLIHLAH
jgi:hypothetical protein